MKKALILPALVAAIWTGIALYWQIRIGRSMRVFETTDYFSHQTCWHETVPGRRASYELLDAGVRALPSLVRSMTPEKSAAYHTEASVLIRQIVTRTSKATWTEMMPYAIELEAPLETRVRGCRRIQDWWLENGERIGRWWQPWERGYRLD